MCTNQVVYVYAHRLHGCPISVYRAWCIIIYIGRCLDITYMYTTVHRHRMSNVCLPLVVKYFPDQVQFVYCVLDGLSHSFMTMDGIFMNCMY